MPNNSSQPPFEEAWQTLRSSLEWTGTFCLVFMFCASAQQKEALFRRADDLMRAQVRPFLRPVVRQATDLLGSLLPTALDAAGAHNATGMPLWLDLDAWPRDTDWNQGRTEFLLRLNERRAALTRDQRRTVVLALPVDWTKRAAEAAPDLWTIRQPGVFLEESPSAVAPAGGASVTVDPTEQVASALLLRSAEPKEGPLPEAVVRWQEGMNSGRTPLSVWDGTRATDAALASGHPELALALAQQSVDAAKVRLRSDPNEPRAQRDLSVSLTKLGDVKLALGDLFEAQRAFSAGSELVRKAIEQYGANPERLCDLAKSAEKQSNVAQALANLHVAQPINDESSKLPRSLIDRLAVQSESLRELSVSMNEMSEVAQALAQDQGARNAYSKGSDLNQGLIDQCRADPERLLDLRDLPISLDTLGEVAQSLGQLALAQQIFGESHKLAREMIELEGANPERLRDLSNSMIKQGDVAQALGQWAEATQAYCEGQRCASDWVEQYGASVNSLEVLADAERGLGLCALAQGDEAGAAPHLERARQILLQLTTAMPHDARYARALAALPPEPSA